MHRKRLFWLGTAMSIALLATFTLLFVNVGEMWVAMRSANYAFVLPALGLYTVSLWFRSRRWRFLLAPVAGRELKRPLLPVVVVGYMALNLIPARVGEVVRSVYLSIREDISAVGTFGTVLLERLSDVLALLLLFALAAVAGSVATGSVLNDFAQSLPGGLTTVGIVALAPFVALVAIVSVVVMVQPSQVAAMLDIFLPFLRPTVRARVTKGTVNLLSGFWSIRTPKGLLKVLIWSIPVWIFELGMYYVIALGFDIRSSFGTEVQFLAAIMIFGVAGNLAGVVPALPGNWGTMDVAGAGALIAVGADNDAAAAFALTVHVALWVPVTIVGAVILLSDRVSLRSLNEDAGRVMGSRDDTGDEMPLEANGRMEK